MEYSSDQEKHHKNKLQYTIQSNLKKPLFYKVKKKYIKVNKNVFWQGRPTVDTNFKTQTTNLHFCICNYDITERLHTYFLIKC